jgi:hypothetical protein
MIVDLLSDLSLPESNVGHARSRTKLHNRMAISRSETMLASRLCVTRRNNRYAQFRSTFEALLGQLLETNCREFNARLLVASETEVQ